MIFSTVFSCSVYILFSCSIYLLLFCCQNCQHLPNVVKMREKNLEMFSKIFFQIIWHSIQCFHILYAFPLVFKTSTVSVLPSKAQMLFLMFLWLFESLAHLWLNSVLPECWCDILQPGENQMTQDDIKFYPNSNSTDETIVNVKNLPFVLMSGNKLTNFKMVF